MKIYEVKYTVWFPGNRYTEGSMEVYAKSSSDAEKFAKELLVDDYPNNTYIAVETKES